MELRPTLYTKGKVQKKNVKKYGLLPNPPPAPPPPRFGHFSDEKS